jgi:hypothetical protein
MTKETWYRYLGTNGVINSPVHLEDIYYVKKYQLFAGNGKKLTKDGVNFVSQVLVPDSEVDLWKEV